MMLSTFPAFLFIYTSGNNSYFYASHFKNVAQNGRPKVPLHLKTKNHFWNLQTLKIGAKETLFHNGHFFKYSF